MTGCCAQIRRSRPLLGTYVEIVLHGAEQAYLHAAADRAFAEIQRIHRLMSRFEEASDVSRMNRLAFAGAVRVEPDTWLTLALARDVAQASNGAFDITVTAHDESGKLRRDPKACYDDVELLEKYRVRFRRRLQVDLGGIAKGYAVDAAAALLSRDGLMSGCVNAGGDLRVFGEFDRQIEIRSPDDPFRPAALARVRNQAIATSACYPAATYYPASGRVLDERGNRAGQGRSATVRSDQCAVADALAKAVLLLGSHAASALARFDASGFLLDSEGLHWVGAT